MKLSRPVAALFVACVLMSACVPATPPPPPLPPPVDTAAEEAALKAITRSWVDAYNAGDAEKIVGLYAADAIVMPPNAPILRGTDAIRAYITNDVATSQAGGVKLAIADATAGASGDLGWESGTYSVSDPAGAILDTGSYVSVAKKSGGTWRLIRDTFHSDRPLPGAAPAAPPAAKP